MALSDRILILASRSWGEMGNIVAAKRLAAILQCEVSNYSFDVLPMEDFYPPMATIGASIARIKSISTDPCGIRNAYRALMREADRLFPPNIEVDRYGELPYQAELKSLGVVLTSPSVILAVGTKGLISRLCVAATRLAGRPDLLQFRIHVATTPTWHIVPGERGVQSLRAVGVPDDAIRAVGHLGSTLALDNAEQDGDQRPFIGMLINHGGEEYWPLVELLADRGLRVRVTIICVQSPNLMAKIQHSAPPHWRLLDRLAPQDYQHELRKVANAAMSLMICKAGPNTVMECLGVGVPVLALQSGLPQEDWVADLIVSAGVGQASDKPAHLVVTLREWLDSPSALQHMRRRALAYTQDVTRSAAVPARIGATMREILSRLESDRTRTGHMARIESRILGEGERHG